MSSSVGLIYFALQALLFTFVSLLTLSFLNLVVAFLKVVILLLLVGFSIYIQSKLDQNDFFYYVARITCIEELGIWAVERKVVGILKVGNVVK